MDVLCVYMYPILTMQAFHESMRKRIQGFAKFKHAYSWPVDGQGYDDDDDDDDDANATPEQFMEQLASTLRQTVNVVVTKLKYVE